MLQKNQIVKVQYNNKEIEVVVINSIAISSGCDYHSEYTNADYLVSDGKVLYLLNEDAYTKQDDDKITTTNIVITKELTTLKELNSINFNHE